MEILDLLKNLECYDTRQEHKVLHKLSEVIGISFFAILCNADDCVDIAMFAEEQEDLLRDYFPLANGLPSHDTIGRVLGMVAPSHLQKFRDRFNELLSQDKNDKLKKILSIDGKTQRGNKREGQKANHIVSAVDNDGFCLSEVLVDEKSNEITAIPVLLEQMNIKGCTVTADAMGTQKEIAALIKKSSADYVLALKGNHGNLFDDVKLYFSDEALLSKCSYHKTMEKARSGIEKREYWQTDDISWLSSKKEWKGLKSLAMTRNTVTKKGVTKVETRYFISSLPVDVVEIARAIRGHWMVESMHWHLDVTFKEDANQTADKQIAFNLNILKKLALNTLKLLDLGKTAKSMKKKRMKLGFNPQKYIELVLSF